MPANLSLRHSRDSRVRRFFLFKYFGLAQLGSGPSLRVITAASLCIIAITGELFIDISAPVGRRFDLCSIQQL